MIVPARGDLALRWRCMREMSLAIRSPVLRRRFTRDAARGERFERDSDLQAMGYLDLGEAGA